MSLIKIRCCKALVGNVHCFLNKPKLLSSNILSVECHVSFVKTGKKLSFVLFRTTIIFLRTKRKLKKILIKKQKNV